MQIRHIVNVGPKRKASEYMPLTTGKMNFYASLTSEETILLNIYIYTNSHPVFQSSNWKRKLRKYTVYRSLLLPIKQRITWSLFENYTTWRFWKGNWILRVHMYLLSWRKINFLCIISILSPKSMSKLINVNCLHFIGYQITQRSL